MMKCGTCSFWEEYNQQCMLPLYTRLDLRPEERVSRCQTCGPLDWCWLFMPSREYSKLKDAPATWLRIWATQVQTSVGRVGPDGEGWEPGTCLQDLRS